MTSAISGTGRSALTAVLASTWLAAAPAGLAQQGSPDARAEFDRVYSDYEAAVGAGNLEAAMELSGEVLELARRAFGEPSEPVAQLTRNEAKMLEIAGREAEAHERFVSLIGLYDELYGPDALRHVAAYMGAGRTLPDPEHERRMRYFRQALDIHREQAPDETLEHAELVVEAANATAGSADGRAELADELDRVLERVEAEVGDESMRLVPILFALGSAEAERRAPRRQKSHYDRALEIIADEHGDESLEYAELSLRAGTNVLAYSRSQDVDSYLEDAHAIYTERLGPEHLNTALAALKRGEAAQARGDTSEAEEFLLDAVEVFDGAPEHAQHEVHARGILAELYTRRDEPELATEQLVALGENQDWPGKQDYMPIVKFAPTYPPDAAREGREGSVIVEYTVDKTGAVVDPVVVSSEGGSEFEEAALESLDSYRYVPRVVDGEPVDVPGVQTRIRFELD